MCVFGNSDSFADISREVSSFIFLLQKKSFKGANKSPTRQFLGRIEKDIK